VALKQKKHLKEMVLLSIEHPEKFLKLGMQPSQGVLLYGPPRLRQESDGKAVGNECSFNFISVTRAAGHVVRGGGGRNFVWQG
jgi:ATP-dependent 26S proteasome regulatory subunit